MSTMSLVRVTTFGAVQIEYKMEYDAYEPKVYIKVEVFYHTENIGGYLDIVNLDEMPVETFDLNDYQDVAIKALKSLRRQLNDIRRLRNIVIDGERDMVNQFYRVDYNVYRITTYGGNAFIVCPDEDTPSYQLDNELTHCYKYDPQEFINIVGAAEVVDHWRNQDDFNEVVSDLAYDEEFVMNYYAIDDLEPLDVEASEFIQNYFGFVPHVAFSAKWLPIDSVKES